MKKWKPLAGDTYYYVSINYCCDFSIVKVKDKKYDGELNYYPDSNNYFESREEAEKYAKKIRKMFGQDPI